MNETMPSEHKLIGLSNYEERQKREEEAPAVDWHAKYTKLVETNAFMIKHNQEHIFKLNVIITFLKEWHEERDDE